MMRRIEPSYPDCRTLRSGSLWLAALCCTAVLCTGCSLSRRRASWDPPTLAEPVFSSAPAAAEVGAPVAHQTLRPPVHTVCLGSAKSHTLVEPAAACAAAERAYAAGCARQRMVSPDCVDYFFQAAVQSWHSLQSSIASGQSEASRAEAWRLYHSSLARLIETGQQYACLDPSGQLSVNTAAGPVTIPMAYRGFAWRPEDFSYLVLVGDYRAASLSHHYGRQGLGVPVVVLRRALSKERFHDAQQQFAATVVLRPQSERVGTTGCLAVAGAQGPCAEAVEGPGWVLEFHDPYRQSTVGIADRAFPLHTDRTAPFGLLLAARKRDYFEEFLQPGESSDEARLIMVEPYQPGKIPLVFVHGLLSDPLTWVDLANEIRGRDDLVARYQLWAFKYPTGEPFVHSAAKLRQELCAAVATLDPCRQDPALAQMVLVGHSMGGLISKLQVASSGDTLWYSVANRPLSQIVAAPEQGKRLQESFYFEPVPYVTRVVFMGTPHRGSSWANRLVGRVGSSMVRPTGQQRRAHEDLVRNNPGAFRRDVRARIPTSIDMLEPDSQILIATQELCLNSAVRLHSIIGNGQWRPIEGAGDGVVAVSSARQAGVESEILVPTDHTGIHNHPDTVKEVVRILRKHASGCGAAPTTAELPTVVVNAR